MKLGFFNIPASQKILCWDGFFLVSLIRKFHEAFPKKQIYALLGSCFSAKYRSFRPRFATRSAQWNETLELSRMNLGIKKMNHQFNADETRPRCCPFPLAVDSEDDPTELKKTRIDPAKSIQKLCLWHLYNVRHVCDICEGFDSSLIGLQMPRFDKAGSVWVGQSEGLAWSIHQFCQPQKFMVAITSQGLFQACHLAPQKAWGTLMITPMVANTDRILQVTLRQPGKVAEKTASSNLCWNIHLRHLNAHLRSTLFGVVINLCQVLVLQRHVTGRNIHHVETILRALDVRLLNSYRFPYNKLRVARIFPCP